MKGYCRIMIVALVGGLALLSSQSAFALVNKAWVSTNGADSGTCTITAPCLTFTYAISQTNAGGEVDVLNTGGYGTFTVAKSISVVAAPGILATINVPSGGVGITVQGNNGDNIFVSGLAIDGHNIGDTGIYVNGFTIPVLSNCTIRNLKKGINVDVGGAFISNSLIVGNANAGVIVNTKTGPTAYITNNIIVGNGNGVQGSIYSFGDNKFANNGLDVSGMINVINEK